MYTPGMIRHTIEELRNLGYTAEQARFIIRNCGTGAGGFSEGNDCAKGKAGKDGDGDGEFEGDKGDGGGKKGGGGQGGKVSGERAEMQQILDDAPRAREVRKEIEETKKKIKALRASQNRKPDRAKEKEEMDAVSELIKLEKEAKGLPSEYDIELATDWMENPPTPPTGDEEFGKPLEPLLTDEELAAADEAQAKSNEAILEKIRKEAPRAREVQKQIKETKKKIKALRASQTRKPDRAKAEEEKAAFDKLFALEKEAKGLPNENDLLEAGVKVEEEKPARRQSRKKRSFSHRLMELRKAGLPISVAIRMSRDDGDD